MLMGLQPSEVRALTFPQFLQMQESWMQAHAPPGKGNNQPPPPPPPAEIARLLNERQS